ncbi:SusC/RagA family TonB-linked outer membrane protein [Pedobacter steynii]|uniref:SusC/RagA family TonB-linked outer membrane protein n=1 Tax=Pedobacter steynii TaxID=430522 RepID=A0A1D7QFG0_9SPHI|nr:SusC/RagA family TonB-linked outer membrane protein [Pedobacter steynii]AOM77365.1 SusC/RagA family TonB-linked outer membrane protein [Pedobacter steynii]
MHSTRFKILKRMLCLGIIGWAGPTFAQEAPVKGIVLDVSGQGLPGVTIKAENEKTRKSLVTTSTGTGLFSFANISPGGPYRFIFSSIGFKTDTLSGYTVTTGQQIALSIKLKEQSNDLQEVTIGYGKSKRNEITGAVTSVKPEEFNRGVLSSPGQLLQGKVAGLNITRSGNPTDKPAVILRGPSSFREGAQEPFYVIDGVPGASIDLVAPDDIISMEVLKDASSTAIYGSRAANGVIMINTKNSGKGLGKLSYSAYAASESISNSIDMATGDELRTYLKDNGKTLDKISDDGSNTDWLKEVTKTGFSQNHNLNFNGGGENSSYGASLNYLDNQGIIKTSGIERFIARANMEQRLLNNRLKLNLNLTNSNTVNDRIASQVYNNMFTYLPTVGVRRADGSFSEDPSRTTGTGGYYNPVALLENNKFQGKTNLYLINGGLKANIIDGLDFNAMVSMQNEQINENLYNNRASMLKQGFNGYAERSSVKNTQKVFEGYFNYDKVFADHGLKLLAGYSWQENRNGDGFQTSGQNFVSDDLLWNNLGLGNGNGSTVVNYGNTYISTLRLISFYGRAIYDYKGKYLLQATLRRDGSSAFGINNRWGMFPSVSAGWNIDREAFMENVTFIDQLKLRAGYGVSGNSVGFDAYTARLVYGAQNGSYFYSNGKWLTAIGPIQNDNPNLKWERTATLNIGLDFGLFNNKLSGSIEVYNKKTTDLIAPYSVSTTQYPFNVLTANVGAMTNKGIEFTLNSTPVKTKDFSWNTAVNLSHNKNEITSISNDLFQANEFYTANVGGRGQSGALGYQVIKEGLPLGSFYTLRYAGKDANGKSMFYDKDGNAATGNTGFEHFTVTGSAQPKLLYGWNNTFRYKQFDFNFFIRGVYGNKILNATLADMNAPIYASQTNIAKVTLTEPISDDKAQFVSDRYLESGSYLRLDNATLGYTFKIKGSKTLRVYASGNNLFIITKYKGVDPEINMAGQTPGIDYRNFYPKTRAAIFGLNFNL